MGESGILAMSATHSYTDLGPWKIRKDSDGRWRVCSDDFKHDVELIITGDFADDPAFVEYAQDIVRRLSMPPSGPSSPIKALALASKIADIMSGESDDARELAQWIIQTPSGGDWNAALNAALEIIRPAAVGEPESQWEQGYAAHERFACRALENLKRLGATTSLERKA